MAAQHVWLVTGASSGLGAGTAISALRAGHKVIACARNPSTAARDHPEVEALGGQWLQLDVTSKDTQKIVHGAIERAGRIDVVVNNAGYIIVSALEDLSDEEIHAQMDTNFFGALRVIRGALPFLRSQNFGTIVTMSSVFGYSPYPAASVYTASKHALEGLSQALALEVAPFNVRVILVEPGLFRTKVVFGPKPVKDMSAAYKGTVVEQALGFAAFMKRTPTRMPGDPMKLGDRLVEFVDRTGLCKGPAEKGFMRLMLGKETMDAWKKQLAAVTANVEAMESIADSTIFDDQDTSNRPAAGVSVNIGNRVNGQEVPAAKG